MENSAGNYNNSELQRSSLDDPSTEAGQGKHPIYRFSAEELRVLRECNKESLLFRCIPLATIFSSGAYYAIMKGHWASSAKYGVFPKVCAAAFAGYVAGKMSYQQVCADKLTKLPDSKLGDAIRKSRNLSPLHNEIIPGEAGQHDPNEVFTTTPATPIFDDHKPDERDRNEGLEEYNKVADSLSEYSLPVPVEAGPAVLTYEDRRRLNREEYNNSRFRKNAPSEGAPSSSLPPPPPPAEPTPRSSSQRPVGRRNKYGDLVYDE